MDIKHLIGNPVFAIETNLENLRHRIDGLSKLGNYGRASLANEAHDICDSIQQSLERIKGVISEGEKA